MKDLSERNGDWVIKNKKPVEIRGQKVVEQRIGRRIDFSPGDLFYADAFGLRLKNHVNAPRTGNAIDKIIVEIQEDIESDPAVLECLVTRDKDVFILDIKLTDRRSQAITANLKDA